MILHKTPRLKKEHENLRHQNVALYGLLEALSAMVEGTLKKNITITHLWRSQEEHNGLYAATDLLARPKSSPHMRYQAVDLRSKDFTDKEIKDIVAWVNANYKNPGGKVSALAHAIAGGAYHLHIQYKL